MSLAYKVIVTGEHDGLRNASAVTSAGLPVIWREVPVLAFEKLSLSEELWERVEKKPFEWIIFTSPRAVRFFSEALMEAGIDFPIETQVACIGEETAEAANQDGFTADFYPTEPGSEKFLEEFQDLVSNNTVKPTILLPMAEGGRTLLKERLAELGCDLTTVALYRTRSRDDIAEQISADEIGSAQAILFTSPSSVQAFTSVHAIGAHLKVLAIGKYTADSLQEKGFLQTEILPEGNFERIGELLC